MDEVEARLRARLADTAGSVRSVMDVRAPGRDPGEDYRSALREAVQRRESAQHDLERYVRRTRSDSSRW